MGGGPEGTFSRYEGEEGCLPDKGGEGAVKNNYILRCVALSRQGKVTIHFIMSARCCIELYLSP